MEPSIMVTNQIVTDLVRQFENDPNNKMMDNLHLFKSQKKCFQSLNWRPKSTEGKHKKFQKQVEEQQKLKHFLDVKQRRETIEMKHQEKFNDNIQKY